MNPYLSEIVILAFGFAPNGFALCNGQLLAINQNQALFALLGTTYGGNGQQTFALPNLQGASMVGMGTAAGLAPITLGQVGGEATVTLTTAQLPVHSHALNAQGTAANSQDPSAGFLAVQRDDAYQHNAGGTINGATATTLAPAALASSGGSQPHANQSPYLVLNACIALAGIFPSQN
jgi:microcystin-dependent protein